MIFFERTIAIGSLKQFLEDGKYKKTKKKYNKLIVEHKILI